MFRAISHLKEGQRARVDVLVVAGPQVAGAAAGKARYHCEVLLAEDPEGVQLDGG